ncbi:hypothetical protein [Ensifer sp. OTU672]|uniref:hypothetical protein n=1 Tax=Ensifer sp. OTU672 TaxID=3043861 RepID=UPI00313C073D
MEALSIQVDSSTVGNATEAFERLRTAIDSVSEALDRLGDKKHGGITVRIVGSLVECEVKPAAVEVRRG